MESALHVIVLAAGKGTRMKSATPKVLQRIGGAPMLQRVLEQAVALGAPVAAIHVVVGHGAEAVAGWLRDHPLRIPLQICLQTEQRGTGHAVAQALPGIPDDARVLVLYGDVPTVPVEALTPLVKAPGLKLLTSTPASPDGYGRIVRDADGHVQRIVEERNAGPQERAIRECNSGILAAPAADLKRWVDAIRPDSVRGEVYLTDCVALAVGEGQTVDAHVAVRSEDLEGVNDRRQLAAAERRYQWREAQRLMGDGLGLIDPQRFDLRGRLRHGRDVIVDIGCVFEGEVIVGDDVTIGPHCVIRNSRIADGVRIDAHSVIDGAVVGAHATVGPFARLRPGATLAEDVHIGNFVEIKQASLGVGTKAGHLAYIGDATVGAGVNISAGVITCNYDGANKHRTTIGDGAFIGTDSQLVAPVAIGEGAYIGAGSTIREDAPAHALTLCRAREQVSKPDWQPPRKAPK